MRLGNPVFGITSEHVLGRRIGGSFVICTAVLVITMVLAGWPAASLGAAEPTQSAQPQDQAAEAAEQARVEGFRSARWGMTEAQVKAAILKDFNIAADKVQTEENSSERTTVLSITANELLEGAGKARVSYILGYSSKKLIQVNVVWGTAIDPQAKPERVVAAANQLRALFSARAMTRRRRPATSRPARARSPCSRARIRKSTRRCCALSVRLPRHRRNHAARTTSKNRPGHTSRCCCPTCRTRATPTFTG